MAKKENKPVYRKMDFNSDGTPTIVDANENEIPKIDNKNLITNDASDSIKTLYPSDKQLVMNRVLGFDDKNAQNISKRQKVFKIITTTIFILFVVAVLAWTAYNDFSGGKNIPSWEELSILLSKHWIYLPCALIALFLCFLFKGIKLSVMCKERTGKFYFKTCMGTAIIGHYYNYVTPLAVGGQPFEIYHLSKHGVKGGVASALPITAFFTHQLAFVFLGILSLIFYNNDILHIPEWLKFFPIGLNILAIIGLFCCIFMPSIVLMFSIFPKLGAILVKLTVTLGSKLKLIKEPEKTKYHFIKSVLQNAKSIKIITNNKLVFLLTFIISICENLALSSIAYFTLRFFGFDIVGVDGIVEWLIICEICILLYAAISFIPTPGNSGAADLSFYLLFQSGLYSLGNIAFPAMIVWRILSFYSFIIIGFIYTRTIKKH